MGLTSTPVYAQPVYQITDDDKKRIKTIHQAWKAYHGELEPPLEKMPAQPDDNVMSNRCRPIIDRGVDFLFGKELEISADNGSPDDVQACINTIWGRKEKRIPLLQKLAMSGAIAGQAFLRIVPTGTDFRLIVIDPITVYVQTEPQDCETVNLYCIQWCSNEQSAQGQPVQHYYREEIARIQSASGSITWSIQHWSRQGDRGPWTASGDPIPWNYPFPPIFSCQNLPSPHSFWGMPDITTDLIHINNALNLVQSCINRINKLYGSPLIYSAGVGETVIDIQPGRIVDLPTTDSKIVSVPITSDLASSLSFADNLRSDIDEQSGVPAVATGRIADLPRGSVSGIAIELLFMPLLKKTEKKRCLYGELILDVSQALLVLNEKSSTINFTLA